MIYLVTLHTGATRLIASQQESLSGGALQFYIRSKSGELRLNQALAPAVWKDCRAVSDKQAEALIAENEAEVDPLVHKDLQGQLPKAPDPIPPRPHQGEGAGGEGRRTASRQPQPKPEGWRNTTLGRDQSARQVSLMWGRFGPFLKVVNQQTQDSVIVNLPKGEDYTALTLTRACQIIKGSTK